MDGFHHADVELGGAGVGEEHGVLVVHPVGDLRRPDVGEGTRTYWDCPPS
jgi:hypothetical protein